MRWITSIFAMPVKSWAGVMIYTLLITSISLAVTIAMVSVLFAEEADFGFHIRAAVIVFAIAPAFGVLTGWHLLRITALSDELRQIVKRDRLTNVATRDYFFRRMREAPDALGTSLMIDIDHFKSVNDTYGHLAGDAVIARVASTISDTVREEDIVCRFGGEEFIVFLSGHSAESGYKLAERIRRAIEQEALDIDGASLQATVSIGGALKDSLTDIDEAIREADIALYRAKAAGRNQTIFASRPEADNAPVTVAATQQSSNFA